MHFKWVILYSFTHTINTTTPPTPTSTPPPHKHQHQHHHYHGGPFFWWVNGPRCLGAGAPHYASSKSRGQDSTHRAWIQCPAWSGTSSSTLSDSSCSSLPQRWLRCSRLSSSSWAVLLWPGCGCSTSQSWHCHISTTKTRKCLKFHIHIAGKVEG